MSCRCGSQKKEKAVKEGNFPKWLHRKPIKGNVLWKTRKKLFTDRLATVCEEAKCPNLLECWSQKTATFLIMGKACTRSCPFCDIDFAKAPKPLDPKEPYNVAKSVKALGLKHVVLTMVARDDLSDGGASHLCEVMQEIRAQNNQVTLEVLTSDFFGNEVALDQVIAAEPEIFNHNIESVRSLTPRVRHKATYDRTLQVLNYVSHRSEAYIKSGFMVGLGESHDEVEETIRDLHQVGVQIITIGQYLKPSNRKLKVQSFVTPEQFDLYAQYGQKIGLSQVYAGPFVRSSYNAASVYKAIKKESA